jgi:hypothetical protein
MPAKNESYHERKKITFALNQRSHLILEEPILPNEKQ